MKNPSTALAALLTTILMVLTACGLVPPPTGGLAASPGPSGTSLASLAPSDSEPANAPNPPPGEAVRFEDVALSDDGATLTLKFVGGKDYSPTDPCSHRYFGWASEVEGTLVAKIVDDTPAFVGANPQTFCDAMGYGRVVVIQLDRPFTGARVQDLAGYVHFVRRPDGVAGITIPAGWTFLREEDVQESETGRWRQSWTKGEVGDGNRGVIDLYQAFDGPANVTGGEEVRQGLVGQAPATLYRFAPNGELVLVWSLDGDGLALVVNESDFPVGAAVQLAESVTIP